uniref:Uncharacterized protein n=1 Tax=Arthrobacter sp. J3.49 TaxID=347213 RepID=I3W1P7_9MICC|nr:hypothetical protein [Arthrobacter sp. J3.49]
MGLAGEQFAQFGRVSHQCRASFFQEPVATCGIGTVYL